MSIVDKLKEIFNRIFGKKDEQLFFPIQEASENVRTSEAEPYVPIEFPENEIVSAIQDNVLHADSRNAEEVLKHNLEILLDRTKKAGKIEKFALIREDDVFPEGWKWDVLSKDTNLEKQSTTLSYELRKAYALRKAGLDKTTDIFGTKMPIASYEETNEALSKVDKNLGSFLLPSRFRSTKHFTINTPLEITGNYNMVDTERDYIVIDNIDNFLKSGYAYSAAYNDAYLDVTHEGLPISEEAIVLIKEENYERIVSDPKILQELAQRRVVKYTGDTCLAVDMVLSEMGVLPSTVGTRYANYDLKVKSIIDNSIKDLASKNKLYFNRSHAGNGEKGHFSNYYDEKNQDYQNACNESMQFLMDKFPDQKALFEMYSIFGKCAEDIVEQVGVDELLGAVNEYNEMAKKRTNQASINRNQDRQNITPEMHKQFTQMVSVINTFYDKIPFDSEFDGKDEIESNIQKFFQGETLEEQQQAGKQVWKTLRPKLLEMQSQKESDKQIIDFDETIRDEKTAKKVLETLNSRPQQESDKQIIDFDETIRDEKTAKKVLETLNSKPHQKPDKQITDFDETIRDDEII